MVIMTGRGRLTPRGTGSVGRSELGHRQVRGWQADGREATQHEVSQAHANGQRKLIAHNEARQRKRVSSEVKSHVPAGIHRR